MFHNPADINTNDFTENQGLVLQDKVQNLFAWHNRRNKGTIIGFASSMGLTDVAFHALAKVSASPSFISGYSWLAVFPRILHYLCSKGLRNPH